MLSGFELYPRWVPLPREHSAIVFPLQARDNFLDSIFLTSESPIRQAFVGLSALTGTCFDELRAVTVELAMEGWVDDSEIAVVDWEMNFCLCCNRYSASWSAKVIGVDRSALIISGEFSSGLASDALGDISPSGTSSALNLFWISMGLLFLPTLVHPWESDKICDCFWKWEVMSFRRTTTVGKREQARFPFVLS